MVQESRSEQCACLSNCSHTIQHTLEKVFGRLGLTVASHPWKVIAISVFCSLLFTAGFSNWTTESRTTKLWIPQGTEAEAQSEWVADTFGTETRTQTIYLRPSDNGNVLTAAYIHEYWKAHFLMVDTSAPASEGFTDEFPGMYSWDGTPNGSISLCQRAGHDRSPDCQMESILDVVGYDEDFILSLSAQDILDLLNYGLNSTGLDSDDLPSIIGGLEYDDDGLITAGAVLAGQYVVSADTILVDNSVEDPSREGWELSVSDALLAYDFSDCKVVPFFAAAFGQEFGAAIGADGIAYSVGCLLLIIYCVIALGKRDYVHSMMGLAVCAILTVGLAVMASYGLAGALAIIYTPLSGSLPFLVLGLGVDDAFIIAGEFQLQRKDDLKKTGGEKNSVELMQSTMRHAGVSILITSVTDFVAFAIGSSTVLPALQAYCLFAAFGVLFVFLLNITFFAACVVLDHERTRKNRPDCCCCCWRWSLERSHPMFPENPASYCGCLHKIPPEISRKMFERVGEAMRLWQVKAAILTGYVAMLGASIYGATQLEQNFKIEWFIPDDSFLQTYYAWQDEFFAAGTPLFVYSRQIDYLAAKDELLACRDYLRNASYLDGDVFDWHSEFWSYADTTMMDTTTSDAYYTSLMAYVSTAGARFNGSIEWVDRADPSLGVAGAFMIGGYEESAVSDASAQVDALYDTRDDMDEIVREDDIFAFSFQMLFWEQYAVISTEFYRNLILAVVVVFGITLLLIPRVSAALLVLLAVVSTIVDVLGFMYFWGLTIDAVTVCYTVIAIGLAVDYSAHVGEAFMLSREPTRHRKVRDALQRVGASVFNGAFSTFLAVVAMASSQTYVFRVFFKQFFLVTLIGSAHGLLVLPVLLELFGPTTAPGSGTDSQTDAHGEDSNEAEAEDGAGRTETGATATAKEGLNLTVSPIAPGPETQMGAMASAPSHSDDNRPTPVPSPSGAGAAEEESDPIVAGAGAQTHVD